MTMDEADPRRPQDPPWRSRTAHRSSSPAAMAALRRARERNGWSMTRAAAETGVSRAMISLLENGLRRPSTSLAEALIGGYEMTGDEADAVRSIAIAWVGRDSPYRTGVTPPPDDWQFAEHQGNGRHHDEHQTDPATEQAPGRPVASAEDWIEWARRKAEAVRRGDTP